MYKRIYLEDGVEVQFVGVYVTRWQPEWGTPTAGFIENEYTLDDAVTDLSSVQLIDNTGVEAVDVRGEIINIFCKLAG